LSGNLEASSLKSFVKGSTGINVVDENQGSLSSWAVQLFMSGSLRRISLLDWLCARRPVFCAGFLAMTDYVV